MSIFRKTRKHENFEGYCSADMRAGVFRISPLFPENGLILMWTKLCSHITATHRMKNIFSGF